MWKRGAVEFIGTFAMVFIGCGSVAMERSSLEISLAFGLIVGLVILSLGRYSGAHINPAVSIAFWRRGDLSNEDTLSHIIGQLCGGALAGGVLSGAGPTLRDTSWFSFIMIEIGITFLLMASILLIIRKTDNWLPIAFIVGATVAVLAFIFGAYTGASMNPARTFGPNLFSGDVEIIPIYWLTTTLGACLAVWLEALIPSKTE
ncbi:aquaporin [Candidatus Poseidoniales archaeon]|nr:aquaporin [Candidatus Poseidoniales archaeon]MDB2671237.1 aquaporin [Candidatus Poseidoniales archaeon]|tara:strand:+ start:5966 stop:6574 length:609 start_codon:yes stop_codon:yes gene_type:complete